MKVRRHGDVEFQRKMKNETYISPKIGKATKIIENWQSATMKIKI